MGVLNDNSMFIKVGTYKEAMTNIDKIKGKVEEAKKSLARVAELKKEEEVEMEIWKKMVNDVEAKLARIDHTMMSAGHK